MSSEKKQTLAEFMAENGLQSSCTDGQILSSDFLRCEEFGDHYRIHFMLRRSFEASFIFATLQGTRGDYEIRPGN